MQKFKKASKSYRQSGKMSHLGSHKSKKWVKVKEENLSILALHRKSHFYIFITAILTCTRKELKLERIFKIIGDVVPLFFRFPFLLLFSAVVFHLMGFTEFQQCKQADWVTSISCSFLFQFLRFFSCSVQGKRFRPELLVYIN